MTQDKLVEQYSGAGASGYDQRRASTPRFRAEEAVFERLFRQVEPEWVVDCPFGTGRWLAQYRDVGGTVVGIDASAAMLAEGARKCLAAGVDVEMKVGSIFDASLFRAERQAGRGLAVCIRFLNWVSLSRAEEAIASISGSGVEYLIVGASVVPDEWSALRRAWAAANLLRINAPEILARRPRPVVHRERAFRAVLARQHWDVLEQRHVYGDVARENYFFLLHRKPQ